MPTGSGRKRNRPTVVCVECRRRKLACDRQQPCRQCTRSGLACVFERSIGHQISGQSLTGTSALPISVGSSESTIRTAVSTQSRQLQSSNDQIAHSCHDPPNKHHLLGHRPDQGSQGFEYPLHTDLVDPLAPEKPRDSLVAGFEVAGFNGQAQNLWKHRFVKSKLFGPTHWRSSAIRVGQFERIAHLERSILLDEQSGLFQLLTECRQFAKQLKADCLSKPLAPNLRTYLPPKATCEVLVQAYLRTFETVFRVLHIPTFRRELLEFWNASYAASDAFVAKLLLVLAIGACFNQESTTSPESSLHGTAAQWIRAVHAWLETPMHKSRINVEGVQIHCLLALAFQTNSVGGDLTWVFSGTLLRMAMSIGLHRDPAYLPITSVLECEVRRRLWTTVLEITLQSSLDSGMPPLIFSASYDCRLPANIDDADADDIELTVLSPKPTEVFTQMSAQCALARSIPVRLRISHLLNGLSPEAPYEDVLRLGAELTTICRANSKLFQSFTKTPDVAPSAQLLAFQTKLVDLLNRRFLLPLHSPFADKAINNPTYYFSRRVCLESSLILLSYSMPPPLPDQRKEDDYTRLRILGRGLFKNTYLLAQANLGLELMAELRTDSAPPTSVIPRNEFHQAVQRITEITLRRVREGETNVKSHLLTSCAMAEIDAIISGSPLEAAVAKAAHDALQTCRTILKDRLDKVNANRYARELAAGLPDPSGLLDSMLLENDLLVSLDISVDPGWILQAVPLTDQQLPDPNLDFDFLNDWLFPLPEFS